METLTDIEQLPMDARLLADTTWTSRSCRHDIQSTGNPYPSKLTITEMHATVFQENLEVHLMHFRHRRSILDGKITLKTGRGNYIIVPRNVMISWLMCASTLQTVLDNMISPVFVTTSQASGMDIHVMNNEQMDTWNKDMQLIQYEFNMHELILDNFNTEHIDSFI
jgi:hypothetical protein